MRKIPMRKKLDERGAVPTEDIIEMGMKLDLSASERFLLINLRIRVSGDAYNERHWPTLKQLASDVLKSERHTRRVLKGLEAKGILSIPKGKIYKVKRTRK